MTESTEIVVVGAGLGGLAAAIALRSSGRDVVLVEQNNRPGGKCDHLEHGGYRFDTGPSILTIPQALDDLFAGAGKSRDDYLKLHPLDPGCRYFFPDGSRFDAPGQLAGFRDAIADRFPGETAGFERFERYIHDLWRISEPVFLTNPLDAGFWRNLRPGLIGPALAMLRPGSMRRTIRAHFRDPRLIQLFCRYATYNGSDPGRAPAAFNVIPYAELAFGSWRCEGGMYSLPRALERLAREIGVEIRYQTPVEQLVWTSDGRVRGIRTAEGEIGARAVVVNADAIRAMTGPLLANHPAQGGWLERYTGREASGSGYVILAAMDRQNSQLALHNVFFCKDYRQEFRDIFGPAQPLRDPTIYVARTPPQEAGHAPEQCEGWFILVNAPSLDRFDAWPEDYGTRILERLAVKGIGFSREHIAWRTSRTPHFFAETYGSWKGALYGLSSNDLMAAFRRVSNRTDVPGLYFAGGSAHPGGGIPLVLRSGQITARLVLDDLQRTH